MRSEPHSHRWSLRAWGLFVSSFVCVTRGILYLPPIASSDDVLPLGISDIARLLPDRLWSWDWQPIWLFGAIWFIVGVAGFVDVFRARRGSALYTYMVALFAIWALGYIGSTVALGSPTGWAAGIVFGVIGTYTELFRRMCPIVRVTSSSVETRLRIEPAAERAFWFDDKGWVEIHPEVIR